MTEVATWLSAQMEQRGYNQIQTAIHTGVSQDNLSETLQNHHIPQIETFFRLADHSGASRVEILILAGQLQRADTLPHALHPDPDISASLAGATAAQPTDPVTQELLDQFRQVPTNGNKKSSP